MNDIERDSMEWIKRASEYRTLAGKRDLLGYPLGAVEAARLEELERFFAGEPAPVAVGLQPARAAARQNFHCRHLFGTKWHRPRARARRFRRRALRRDRGAAAGRHPDRGQRDGPHHLRGVAVLAPRWSASNPSAWASDFWGSRCRCASATAARRPTVRRPTIRKAA